MSDARRSSQNRYGEEARARRKADNEAKVEIFLPARVNSQAEPFRPRALEELNLPLPQHAPRHWLTGESNYRAFANQFDDVTAVAAAQRGLREEATRLEIATQELERTRARRQQLPKLIEMDAINIEMALIEQQEQFAERQARQHRRPLEQQRDRELDDLDYQIALAAKEKQLAEERATAERAKAEAELAERTARANAEAKAFKKEGEREEARAEAERHRSAREEDEDARRFAQKEGLPPEMARYLKTAQQRRRYDDIAEKKIAEILASVEGDESALTAEQQDELDDWREAAARAKTDLDKASAALDFPTNGKGG
jgi:colicin import membrane protein